LYAAIGCVLSQSVHKLFKSFPQKNRNTTCIFIFYKKPQKKGKRMILMGFIFVELEINMWITMGCCPVVADN
jgi:hypothetical protein